MKKKRNVSRGPIIIFACVLAFALLFCSVLQIGYVISKRNAYVWKPDYEKVEISALLDKQTLSDEDYDLIYSQTGLTRIGVDRALEKGYVGKQRILEIQNSDFSDYEIRYDKFAPWMCTERITKSAKAIYLEDGDIIITASTHVSFFRMGHSGLVTDGDNNKVLQAVGYEEGSEIGDIYDFTNRINFMVLRPKASAETRKLAAEYGATLTGIEYAPFIGINKRQTKMGKTQCAHLVWYAYHMRGFELIDKNKLIALPYDLANSDEVELVQTFGFDPDELWNNLVH